MKFPKFLSKAWWLTTTEGNVKLFAVAVFVVLTVHMYFLLT